MSESTRDEDLSLLRGWISHDLLELKDLKEKSDINKYFHRLMKTEEDIQAYLYEILKEKYKDPKQSENYKKYIKGGEFKDKLEESIFKKSILDDKEIREEDKNIILKGIKSINCLLNDILSLDDSLLKLLKELGINPTIIPGEFLPRGSRMDQSAVNDGKKTRTGKRKSTGEVPTGKVGLLIYYLNKRGIKNDDLNVAYPNEGGYLLIYIPKLYKTIFINEFSSHATYICDGEISIERAKNGKAELINLGAKKINYWIGEQYDADWVNRIMSILFGITPEQAKEQIKKEIKERREERFNLNTENRRDFKLHERIVNIERNRDVCGYKSIYTLFMGENKYYSWSDENFLELSRAIFGEDDEEVKKLEKKSKS